MIIKKQSHGFNLCAIYENNILFLKASTPKEQVNNIKALKTLTSFASRELESKLIDKILNCFLQEQTFINQYGGLNGSEKYEIFFNIKIKKAEFTNKTSVIEIQFNEIEEKTKFENRKETEVMNGNYVLKENIEINGINTVWYKTKNKKAIYQSTDISVDIETDYINEVYSCISFSIGDVNNKFYMTSVQVSTNDKTIETMFETIYSLKSSKKKQIKCYVHNLTFDGSYILSYLINHNFKEVTEDRPQNDKEYGFLYAGGILKIEMVFKDCEFMFLDTFRLMSKSLDAISKSFKGLTNLIIEKSDTSYDYNKGRTENEVYNNDEIVYCINDVVVTSFIPSYFKTILFCRGSKGLKLTASSCAYNEFKLSLRFGVFSTDILIETIKYMLSLNDITQKTFRQFCKKNDDEYVLCDYYSEHRKIGITDFLSFKDKILNYETKLSFSEIVEKCKTNSVYFEKLINDGFNAFEALRFLCFSPNGKIEKNKSEKLKELWFYFFPKLAEKEDDFFRKMYFGGISAPSPNHLAIKQENINGFSIDINSSYPDKLVNYPMPYGNYTKISDEKNISELISYIENNDEYLKTHTVFVRVVGNVVLKNRHLPIIINKSFNGIGGQLISGSIDRYLTYYEYLTFKNSYMTDIDIYDIVIFKATDKIFKSYYNRYYSLKNSYKGINPCLYDISKVLLNGLYGKFAENWLEHLSTYYTIAENNSFGLLSFCENEKEIATDEVERHEGRFLPIAICTASYGRVQLINAVNEIVENGADVLYTDTDSMYISTNDYNIDEKKYLNINGSKTNIMIDGNVLGAWDLEKTFDTFVVYAPKRYGLIYDKNSKKAAQTFIRCAGVSQRYTKDFNIDDIKYNAVHNSLKSEMTKNGREIKTVFKTLGYKENVYKTSDGQSLQTDKKMKVGEKCLNKYGIEKTIQEKIYEV